MLRWQPTWSCKSPVCTLDYPNYDHGSDNPVVIVVHKCEAHSHIPNDQLSMALRQEGIIRETARSLVAAAANIELDSIPWQLDFKTKQIIISSTKNLTVAQQDMLKSQFATISPLVKFI